MRGHNPRAGLHRRIVGIVSVALILAFVWAGLVLKGMFEGADAYVKSTLPDLATNWSREDLRRQLSTYSFSDKDIVAIAKIGPRDLGKITTMRVHRATLSTTSVKGRSAVRFCYAIPVTFEKGGQRSVSFYVERDGGPWKAVVFDVDDTHGNNLFKPVPASAFSKTAPSARP